MEHINKAKTFIRDHAILVGGAAVAATAVVVYYLFVRQKKYCPNCNAWVSQMDPSCPYCNEKTK